MALVALAVLLPRVEAEIVELRTSLRRSQAAAVATDELHRSTRDVAAQAAVIDTNARRRADLRRSRRRARHR